MSRNKIYAIVEGQGEAHSSLQGKAAIVVLLGKLLNELQCWTLFPNEKHPSFRMSYGAFFRGDKLERAIRYHKKYEDCAALLVLLDMDNDCPKEKALEIVNRIRAMEKLDFSTAVVCARREYESWFLASLETIQDTVYPAEPEERRDAKGWLSKEFGYKPTRHQAIYTQKLDLSLATMRSRSFRRMYHAVSEIVESHRESTTLISLTSF